MVRKLSIGEGLLNLFLIWACTTLLFSVGYLTFVLASWSYAVFVLMSFFHQRYLSEWMHEACHFNLWPGARQNDWLANTSVCWFFLSPLSVYRTMHFQHHGHTDFFNKDDDETRMAIVRTYRELVMGIIQDLTGISAARRYFSNYLSQSGLQKPNIRTKPREMILILIGHLLFVVLSLFWGILHLYLLYYLIIGTIYTFHNRSRLFVQHIKYDKGGRIQSENCDISRSVRGSLLSKLFYSSDLLAYHYEHHKYPSLTFRQQRAICKPSADPNVFVRTPFLILKDLYRGLP